MIFPYTIKLVSLLAMSCIGEAGWDSHETGECVAIIHVYLKRRDVQRDVLQRPVGLGETVRAYSMAVRRNSRRWVKQIDRKCAARYNRSDRYLWHRTLPGWAMSRCEHYKATKAVALDVLYGRTPDPYPEYIHFGGWFDKRFYNKPGWSHIRPFDKVRNGCVVHRANLFWRRVR